MSRILGRGKMLRSRVLRGGFVGFSEREEDAGDLLVGNMIRMSLMQPDLELMMGWTLSLAAQVDKLYTPSRPHLTL